MSVLQEAVTTASDAPGFSPGRFMVVARDHWDALWRMPTVNRLNLVAAYLVLLAGTTSNNRLTTWSASACERYAGVGFPRARTAIQELIDGGLAALAYGGRRNLPQYRLAARGDRRAGIFLPLSLVVGPYLDRGSVLRCVREIGDPLVLRLLVDLHGLVQPDVTFGVALTALRQGRDTPALPVAGHYGYTVWELKGHEELVADGDWLVPHLADGRTGEDPLRPFWRRLDHLRGLDVLTFEPWVFDSAAMDAEPLFPLVSHADELGDLHRLRRQAVQMLSGIAEKQQDYRIGDAVHVVRPGHCQPPVIRGVVRLRIDAPTPGLQRAMDRRSQLIFDRCEGYQRLLTHLHACDTADSKAQSPAR